ncbi:alpha-tectorin-like [Astyanax mexicanus]|uniref:alpha-tectorin-like n=1 Tax=Astyanax mexicanus TaxID=7994 RepID=UPI0020CB2D2C|nr:alpha-tectorin-like [Astyanax mexicanus]
MDGFLSFEPLSFDGFALNVNKDIIAPLWTDIDTHTRGDISYTQATNGTLLKQASDEINRMFPGTRFTASWVFVATWEKMEFEPDTGEVTFQVALVSDIDSDVSFIIMNYGSIPDDPESWMAGYQTEGNKHQYRIQAPSTSQLSKTSNVGIPGRWAFRVDACSAVNCTAREECKARSGIYGCACANNNPRFNAATFDAYNYCNSSSGVLSLSRCELFEAGFPSDFLHLNDPSCGGDIQDDRVVFTFDNKFRICGTTMQSNSTHFIYENTVRVAGGVSSGSVISRDSWLDMKFSCVYPLIQSISMSMSIHASGSVVSKILPGTESAYQLRLVTYSDSSFITPYSGNITIEVNQQVFIAVEADGIDSSQFATVLDSCWATPYNDINYPVRWDLIINECPNEKDGTVEVLQNGIWTASHFSFRMFTFTGISNNIFLHCQVHLCPRMSGQCSQPCNKNDDDDQFRGRRRRSVDFHDKASISMSF